MIKFSQEQINQMRANWDVSTADQEGSVDHVPVARIFLKETGAQWIVTEIKPDMDIMFGLADLGLGEAELGYISIKEINQVEIGLGFEAVVDPEFTTEAPISFWAEKSRPNREIPRAAVINEMFKGVRV